MKKWIAVMVGLLAIDQVTKRLIAYYKINQEIIKGLFRLRYDRNPGMVFGFFQGATETHTFWLASFAVLALAIFIYLFLKIDLSDKRTTWLTLGISFLIAGTLGNAIDRLVQPSLGVIDFLDFYGIWSYNFNFADVYLNVGLGLFFIDAFFLEKQRVTSDE